MSTSCSAQKTCSQIGLSQIYTESFTRTQWESESPPFRKRSGIASRAPCTTTSSRDVTSTPILLNYIRSHRRESNGNPNCHHSAGHRVQLLAIHLLQQIITLDHRNVVKEQVVALVAMVPPILQLPLGDTIGIIADTDFYQQWLNLVPVSPSFDQADSRTLLGGSTLRI